MKCLLIAVLCSAALRGGQIVYQRNIPASMVALDAAGNVYAAGSSVVTKLDAGGNIIYSKQPNLPGTWTAIAADSAGEVVIVGWTGDDGLPTTSGVFQPKRNSAGMCVSGDRTAQPVACPDAFVAKLDVNGNLTWATYLGGSAPDQANAVAVDATGNVFVAGFTLSPDFYSVSAFQPMWGGYADGFVTKLSADGARILYSSFMGGGGYDVAHAIAVDAGGNAYVAGEVQGSGLSVTAGSFGASCQADGTNAFLIKVSLAGDHLNYGACFAAGVNFSAATAVAIDGQGHAYVGGYTNSSSFPATAGAFQSLTHSAYIDFVAKISGDGSKLLYSSLFDGADFGILSIAVDSTGAVFATGETSSTALPIFGPAMQPCPGPSGLSYNILIKLNPAGSAATYLSFEEAAGRIAVSPDGSLHEALGTSLRKIAALDAPGGPFLSSQCVLNGASFVSHLQNGQPGISPGEIVTLEGTGLGPSAPPPVAYGLPPPFSLAGVQVFFDEVAAPLLYVQDRQLNVVAPYELQGKTQTSIQVQYLTKVAPAVTIPVSTTSPAVFRDFVTGDPMVFNADFSRNSAANPVARGSAVVLFITGGGQTSSASTDAEVWKTIGGLQASVSARLQNISSSPITFTVPVLYAGPAPTEVSGVQQVNVGIPADLPVPFISGVAAGNGFLSVTVGSQTITVPVVVR